VGQFLTCDCPGFRLQPTDPIARKYPKANNFTPCVKCGHWKSRHCTKRKPAERDAEGHIVRKPGGTWTDSGAWRADADQWMGFADESGRIAPCKHTPEDPVITYRCDSTACAMVIEGVNGQKEWCPCSRFEDPFAQLRKESRAALQPAKPRIVKPRKKKGFAAFITGQRTLFPVHAVGETATND
jgi:hypothetical protein